MYSNATFTLIVISISVIDFLDDIEVGSTRLENSFSIMFVSVLCNISFNRTYLIAQSFGVAGCLL